MAGTGDTDGFVTGWTWDFTGTAGSTGFDTTLAAGSTGFDATPGFGEAAGTAEVFAMTADADVGFADG